MQRECGETLKQIINGFWECKNAFTAIAGETRWKEFTSFMGNKNMYFILTCEGSIGNAGKYLAKLCKRKNMHNAVAGKCGAADRTDISRLLCKKCIYHGRLRLMEKLLVISKGKYRNIRNISVLHRDLHFCRSPKTFPHACVNTVFIVPFFLFFRNLLIRYGFGVFFVVINCIYLSFMQIHAPFYINYIIYYGLLIFCCQNVAAFTYLYNENHIGQSLSYYPLYDKQYDSHHLSFCSNKLLNHRLTFPAYLFHHIRFDQYPSITEEYALTFSYLASSNIQNLPMPHLTMT